MVSLAHSSEKTTHAERMSGSCREGLGQVRMKSFSVRTVWSLPDDNSRPTGV